MTVEVRGHLEFGEAMSLFRRNAEQRREALRDWRRTIETCEKTEIEHAHKYAQAIAKAEGTQSVREALAKAEVIELKAKINALNDLKKVCQEQHRGLEGERANLNNLVQWSRSLDGGTGG